MPRAFPYLATKVCNILAPFAMEFVGTFFLVAAVGFNSVSAHPLAPLGIGLTLVVNKIGGLDAIIYVVVQVAAAFLAALFCWGVTDKTVAVQPALGVSDAKAFGVEAMWTFLLATVVLQTATTETQAGNSFFGLSIGSTVIAGAITVGPTSGGVFNPAVGTGMLLAHACDTHDTEKLHFLWIYWLAPLLGGLVAGIMFWFTNRREFHDEPRLEGDSSEHLFSMDVKSIADVSAQKREGGKLIKDIMKRERERFEHLLPNESTSMINVSE